MVLYWDLNIILYRIINIYFPVFFKRSEDANYCNYSLENHSFLLIENELYELSICSIPYMMPVTCVFSKSSQKTSWLSNSTMSQWQEHESLKAVLWSRRKYDTRTQALARDAGERRENIFGFSMMKCLKSQKLVF